MGRINPPTSIQFITFSNTIDNSHTTSLTSERFFSVLNVSLPIYDLQKTERLYVIGCTQGHHRSN